MVALVCVLAGLLQGSQAGVPVTPLPSGAALRASGLPDEHGVYDVGGEVLPPKVVYEVTPEVPSQDLRHIHGSVDTPVQLIVDREGKPQDVHITRIGRPGLDGSAVAAVKQYRFRPATKNGSPVPVHFVVVVNVQHY